MNVKLRAGTQADAAPCGTICYEAFKAINTQHNFPPDFPSTEVASGLLSMMLARPQFYSVVAELDGRVVGSNFLDPSVPASTVSGRLPLIQRYKMAASGGS
jgi:hypothetical protein